MVSWCIAYRVDVSLVVVSFGVFLLGVAFICVGGFVNRFYLLVYCRLFILFGYLVFVVYGSFGVLLCWLGLCGCWMVSFDAAGLVVYVCVGFRVWCGVVLWLFYWWV